MSDSHISELVSRASRVGRLRECRDAREHFTREGRGREALEHQPSRRRAAPSALDAVGEGFTQEAAEVALRSTMRAAEATRNKCRAGHEVGFPRIHLLPV